MGDFDPKAVDWGRVFAEAVALALAFTKRDAEDVVQLGMTLLFEGEAPFDPAGKATLAEHLVREGLRARKNRERTHRRRRRPGMLAKLVQWFDDPPPSPEELNEERQRRAKAFERLLAAAADDPEVCAIVRLEEEGVHEAADQQQRLGWPIEVVRNARKRMTRHVQALAGRTGDDVGSEDRS